MDKQYAYQEIYEDFVDKIQTGELPVGTLLPSEMQVAQSYGVSRITSRRALQMLADGGYINRIRGKGSIVTQRSGARPMIGLVLPDFDNVFGLDLVRGVLAEAYKKGYFVLVQSGYFTSSQACECLQRLIDAGVQGIIHMPLYEYKDHLDAYHQLTQQVPFVFVDREIYDLNVPLVCTDNVAATYQLCNRLYKLGHRKIAFVSSKINSSVVEDRYKGYLNFCREMHIVAKNDLVYTEVRSVLPGMDRQWVCKTDVEELVRFFQDHREITAVVVNNYRIGKLVRKAITQMGFRIPQEYSVVCFDSPNSVEPGWYFTHIRQNERLMSQWAVEMIAARIEGRQVQSKIYVDGQFVEGKSIASPW